MVKKEMERISQLGKKVVGLGLGLASITEKKVREAASELIKKGEIKKEAAGKFVDNLLKKTEKDRKGIEERISALVKKTVEKLPLATKGELDEIRKKIKDLEKKI